MNPTTSPRATERLTTRSALAVHESYHRLTYVNDRHHQETFAATGWSGLRANQDGFPFRRRRR